MATQGLISSTLQDPLNPDPLAATQQTLGGNPATAPAPAAATPVPAAPTPATAAPAPATVATPTPWVVDDKQTVAGQVRTLIDENSPLIQQARTQAKQQSNERGLMNSAMAVSAGETAAYNAALPIATADASTQAKAAGYSVDQINQANVQNAKFAHDVNMQQIVSENSKLLQSNSTASSLMNQATGVINNIMMNDKMDANAKTEASRQVYENLRTQLSIISATSGLDLASILGTNPYPGYADVQASAEQTLSALDQSQTKQADIDAMLADYKRRLAADAAAQASAG